MLNLLDYIASTEVEGQSVESDTLVETTQESVETEVDTEVQVDEQQGEVEVTPELSNEIEIDGEKYSLDDIREWRKGNMRQADYTKKTTELAQKRKEAEEALEVYNYLMSKPDLVKKLHELDSENPVEVKKVSEKLDPVAKQINELNQKLLIKDIEAELKEITSKDKLVNDVELLELANQMKCPISVAYDIWKGKNVDKILKSKEQEVKRKLAEEIKTKSDTTRTLIKQTDANNDKGTFGLTDEQIMFAEKLGMTTEEYSKYMSNPW